MSYELTLRFAVINVLSKCLKKQKTTKLGEVDILRRECKKHTTHTLTPWPSNLLLKNPSLLDSCQWFPSNPSKQQETENGIPSERPCKRKAPTMETGKRGWGALVLQLTLFSWASSGGYFPQPSGQNDHQVIWDQSVAAWARMKLFLIGFMRCQYRHQGRVTEARTAPPALCGSEYSAWHLKTFRHSVSPYQSLFIRLVWSIA